MIHTRFQTSKRVASFLGLAALVSTGVALSSQWGSRTGQEASVASPVRLAALTTDNLTTYNQTTDSQEAKAFPITDALVAARLKPVPGARAGSFEEMSRVLTRDQFEALTTPQRALAREFLLRSREGKVIAQTCFAPGTPLKQIRAFASLRSSINARGALRADSRWTSTANDTEITRGEPFKLTWGIVPDGTKEEGDFPGASDLKAFVTKTYGSEEEFRAILRKIFARYSELSGITYEEVNYDDGAEMPGNAGENGVRPDIRIGGHAIDGDSGILAYNYFPNSGDMIIDTTDNFYENDTTRLGMRNVLTHEHGHGLGFNHVCPIDQTKLMEPFVSFKFDGIQLDDRLATQFYYGDGNEKGALNNTTNTATDLGPLTLDTARNVNEVSINATDDVDVFRFTPDTSERAVTIELKPVGPAYLEGPQNDDGSCSDGTPFDPGNQRNLNLQLLDSTGNILTSSALAAAGSNETITKFDLPGSGPFFARVLSPDTADKVQGYSLAVTVVARANRAPQIFNLRFDPKRPGTDSKLRALFDVVDPDGDTHTETLVWKKNGASYPTTGNTIDLSQPGVGDVGDVFQVTVISRDSFGNTSTATISVTVQLPNMAPKFSAQTFSVSENKVLNAKLTAQDANTGDKLTFSRVTSPKTGTVSVAKDGTLTYTPKLNFNGSESFIARVVDQEGLKGEATITIQVNPVNSKPIIADDVVKAQEDVLLTITAATLLKNDRNGENSNEVDPMRIVRVERLSVFQGTLIFDANRQTLLYASKTNGSGEDRFRYFVQDSAKNESSAIVTIQVAPVNDAPTAVNLEMTAISNTVAEIEVSGADLEGDVAEFRIASAPKYGKASIVEENGKWFVVYRSKAGFSGKDLVTYVARDGFLSSKPANIIINVQPNVSLKIVSVSPDKGRFAVASKVTFIQKVKDSNGTNHIDAVALLISNSATIADAKNAASLWYDAQNNVFTITTDDGKTFYTPVALGQSIYNSQVKVTLGKNDVIRNSDGTLTLNWQVTFNSRFVGTKTLWSRVEDLADASDGFTKKGTIVIGSETSAASSASSF